MNSASAYYANVGSRLRYARNAIGMTRGELGRLLGISQQTVYNIESGKVKISLDKTRVIAEAMGCSVDWLCGAVDETALHGEFMGRQFDMTAKMEPFEVA